MIKENIDKLIKEAMLSKDSLRLDVLRGVKTAFMSFETAKNAKPLDETSEIQILKKMVAQRIDASNQYKEANRLDLSEKEILEVDILKEFLPEEVSDETIWEYVLACVGVFDGKPTMKDMGSLIKRIKEDLPNADGKRVSEIVKEYLSSL